MWRDTLWDLEEAAGIYARCAGMVSLEMHSPIMCIGLGVPAIVCRWEEQSSKGVMWRDIGLGDWLFDMDADADRARVPATVLSIAKDPAAAREKVKVAQKIVAERQAATMKVLAEQFEK